MVVDGLVSRGAVLDGMPRWSIDGVMVMVAI